MNYKNKIAIVAILSFILAGCGEGNGPETVTQSGEFIAVKIVNATGFNTKAEHGRIERYKVKIEGPGIEEPIIAEFAGDAQEGIIDGIPAGDDRMVSVEAINPNDTIIRAGEAFDISTGSGVTEVNVSLEAVPIFTNITDKSAIENTRLIFRLFSDPKDPVAVEEMSGESAIVLADAATSAPEVTLDASTGLGKMAPPALPPGEHTFRVKDITTGRATEVTINLLDGTKRRPAPLVTAGSAAARMGDICARRSYSRF